MTLRGAPSWILAEVEGFEGGVEAISARLADIYQALGGEDDGPVGFEAVLSLAKVVGERYRALYGRLVAHDKGLAELELDVLRGLLRAKTENLYMVTVCTPSGAYVSVPLSPEFFEDAGAESAIGGVIWGSVRAFEASQQ